MADQIHQILGDSVPVDYSLDTKQSAIKNAAGVRAASVLQLWAQLVFFPLAIGIITTGLLIRWGKRLSDIMWKIGIQRKQFARLLTLGVGLAAAIAGIVGALAGSLIAGLSSPILIAVKQGAPLNDESSALFPGMLAAIIVTLGSIVTAMVGLRVRRKPRLVRTSRKLNPSKSWIIGAAFMATALGAAIFSDGRLWWVIVGALVMVAAFAAFTPLVLAKIATYMDSVKLSPRVLASRIIADNLRHWGVLTAMLTAIFGIVVALFGVASATVAAAIPLQRSIVPAGVTMLQTHLVGTQDLSDETIKAFECDLGIQNPVLATESLFIQDKGMILSFKSIPDLEAAIGQITNEQQEFLNSGGILTPFISGIKTIEVGFPDESTHQIKAMGYTPPTDRRYRTAGFSLTSTLPKQFQNSGSTYQYLLYYGLTPEQDLQAREWAKDTGRSNVVAIAHHGDAELQLPLGAGISLVGFGIFFCPVVWVLLRREAIYLRPIIATTILIGIPKRWGVNALKTIAWLNVTLSAAIAILATVFYLIILTISYQGEAFDMLGVPWWVLAMFIAGLIAGTLAGSALAARKLNHKEATQLI